MTPKNSKCVSQSQTADKPMALRGIATQQSRDTRKTNEAKQTALSLPHQDDRKTRMGIKLQNIEQLQNPLMGVTINNESTTESLP